MDNEDAKKTLQKQLNGGASSLVLLALLHQADQPMYGYQIAKELERQNGGPLPMKPGALYPVLRSLEKQELLTSDVVISDEGRARKYYQITESGRQTTHSWRQAWNDTKQFIDTVLENGNESDRASGTGKGKVLPGTRRRVKKRSAKSSG